MAEDKQHIIYSSEDIHQYLSGKLSSAQMHAMERAALSDPLLADAIDGYNEIDFTSQDGYISIQNDLAELRQKIDNTNTVSINTYKNRWWQVAAAVLILGTAFALALYKLNNTTKKPAELVKQETIIKADSTIAVNGFNTVVSQDSITTVAAADKPVSVTETPLAATSTPNTTTAFLAIKDSDGYYNDSTVSTQGTIVRTDHGVIPVEFERDELKRKEGTYKNRAKAETSYGYNNTAGNGLMNTATTNAKINSGQTFLGKVVDNNAAPVPYASIIINNNKESKTDANGMFSIGLDDSVATLTAVSRNYAANTISIHSNKYNTIILSPKKIVFKNTDSKGKNNHRSLVYVLSKGNAEPTEGWEKYEQHLINLLSDSEYDDGKMVTGDMIISFEINTNFVPVNFAFEQSINSDVDEAIENLIKNESDWKAANNKSKAGGTIRLRIVF